jgi:hypothetical protein
MPTRSISEKALSMSLGVAPGDRLEEVHVAEPAGQHVLHHREAVDQVEALEDHADLAAGRRSCRPLEATSSVPLSRIDPEVGSTRRLIQRSMVLLPAPEAPTIETTLLPSPSGRAP